MWVNPGEHKAVGEVLAEFRKRAGLRQEDVAARLGKPQSFVSSYEGGQRRIDVLELMRIAASLGADPCEVFAAVVGRHSKLGIK